MLCIKLVMTCSQFRHPSAALYSIIYWAFQTDKAHLDLTALQKDPVTMELFAQTERLQGMACHERQRVSTPKLRVVHRVWWYSILGECSECSWADVFPFVPVQNNFYFQRSPYNMGLNLSSMLFKRFSSQLRCSTRHRSRLSDRAESKFASLFS
jgi:hypothetical protein